MLTKVDTYKDFISRIKSLSLSSERSKELNAFTSLKRVQEKGIIVEKMVGKLEQSNMMDGLLKWFTALRLRRGYLYMSLLGWRMFAIPEMSSMKCGESNSMMLLIQISISQPHMRVNQIFI